MSRFERMLIHRLLLRAGNPPVQLRLGAGEPIAAADGPHVARLTFRDRRTLFRLALNPDLYFGEGYMEGRIAVEGDLLALLEAIASARTNVRPGLIGRWFDRQRSNTLGGSRRNIHHHYDIGNDFYRLWLDEQLVYTCAYFPKPDDSLEAAQIAKMDYVCRKLDLRPGERVVEAGCGWGAQALYMARHYGIEVRAFNISKEQIAWARARARAEGLEGKVEFVEDDYRNISGSYDAFVSVGMLEHVGLEHYAELGRVIQRAVQPAGRAFLHFIGRDRELPLNAWIRRRIFPGAYPPTLRQALEILEPHGFAVLDVENLRLHYARTLEHWLQRFDRAGARVEAMFGPEFVRAWRLYLAGSAASFRAGWLQLFQVSFARRASNRMPWTRARLYTDDLAQEGSESWIPAMS